MPKRNIDITNTKFNRLTAINKIGVNKRNNVLWNCICDCGNSVVATANDLLTNRKKSCGCFKSKISSDNKLSNILNQKFSRLSVIKQMGINKDGKALWQCMCDCGNTIVVIGNSLRFNHTKSCGCLHKDFIMKGQKGEKSHRWKGGITTEISLIRHSVPYKFWRKLVFERDNYTCILCGARNGNGKKIILNADHIKPFSIYPELRFELTNGRTLCLDCHKQTDTFGGRTFNAHSSILKII